MSQYACRNNKTLSLKHVPPGSTRRETFCPQCTAQNCLFGGEVAERQAVTDQWIPVPLFASQMAMQTDTIYRYIRAGMPAEKRPFNGNGRTVLGVRPSVARQWIDYHC